MFTNKFNERLRFGFLCCLFCFWFLSISAVADGQSELGFNVLPVLPESQVEEVGYFNLELEPGDQDTLRLRFASTATDPIDIQISAHTAYTNVHGVVEYGRDAEEPNPTLTFPLDSLLEVPDIVTLAPGETQEIVIPLTMPEESFAGLLVGGLKIEEVDAEDESLEEEGGLAVENKFSYVIGVVVRNNPEEVTPDLELLEVFADHLNYRNVFSATIQNYTPTFVNQLEVEAQVRALGETEVLYEANKSGMQMAPNSHFNYPISLNGERFRSGDYVLNMTARSGDYEWTWEETFTVDQETARHLNREDVTLDGLNWWMIGTIGLGVILVSVIGYLWYNQRKVKKEQQQDK